MPFDATATIATVLDEALREARDDLAELERLGERLALVPEDGPGHQELLDAYGRRLEHAQANHLSPRLCDELEDALGAGPGAIVVASHDRWLRRRWQGRELRLEPGRDRREEMTPTHHGPDAVRSRPRSRQGHHLKR